MSGRRRLLAYLAGVTVLVGALAGVLGALVKFSFVGVGHYGLAHDVSGPGARSAHSVLRWFGLAILAGTVGLPLTVAAIYARRGDGHPVVYAAYAVVAVFSLPGALVILVETGHVIPHDRWFLTLVVLASVLAVLGAFVRRAGYSLTEVPAWPFFLNHAVVVLLVVGMIAGGGLAAPRSDAVVESEQFPTLVLHAEYESLEEGGGLVTFQYVRPESMGRDQILVRGDGFAAVEGADQTTPGPWRGETTGGPDGNRIAGGDTLVVGVERNCRLLVYYRNEHGKRLFAIVDCADLREQS